MRKKNNRQYYSKIYLIRFTIIGNHCFANFIFLRIKTILSIHNHFLQLNNHVVCHEPTGEYDNTVANYSLNVFKFRSSRLETPYFTRKENPTLVTISAAFLIHSRERSDTKTFESRETFRKVNRKI
jgi:hypothetical protein